MPAHSNRVWTFDDLHEGGGHGISTADDGAAGAGSPQHLTCCYHIPTLPKAEQAQKLLQRVVREFEPIAKQRGYNIQSVSELCCCGDGLDHQPGRRRKLRRAADNIWGYNQTSWGRGSQKSSTIHLRLRHPSDHSKFLLYEDVAGTMAHEMAHCVHGPHNDKFFKLMDEILEQHAVLMASGLSSKGYSMPAFGGTGQTLGGSGTTSIQDVRRQQQAQSRGYKLGGDNAFTEWMTPAEAAVVAAEARRRMQQLRLRGDRCCRPVTIQIDDDDEDADNDDDKDDERGEGDVVVEAVDSNKQLPAAASKRPLNNNSNGSREKPQQRHLENKRSRGTSTLTDSNGDENRKPAARKTAPNSQVVSVTAAIKKEPLVIDLTSDDNEGDSEPVVPEAAAAAVRAATTRSGVASAVAPPPSRQPKWPCRRCTFLNLPTVAVCAMCEVQLDDVSTQAYRLRTFK